MLGGAMLLGFIPGGLLLALTLGGGLGAYAAVAALDLGSRAVAAAVLLNPVACFRVLALSQVDIVAGGFGSVMASAGLSTPVVAAGLAGWTLVPAGLAAWLLGRRRR